MPPPDETHRGVEIVVDILVVVGGVAVERGCGRHLKNSYNAYKISWGSQAKMVSKCNRIASLVILNYKIFLGGGGGGPPNPLLYSPLVPSALGEHQRCSMAVPLSKSRRRPWNSVWSRTDSYTDIFYRLVFFKPAWIVQIYACTNVYVRRGCCVFFFF